MTSRLLASFLLVVVVVIATFAVPLGIVAAALARQSLDAALERDAVVIAQLIEEQLEGGATAVELDLDTYLAEGGARIVITDTAGISVYDSDANERRDYSSRPEIQQALGGQRAVGERTSTTLDTTLRYIAVPVFSAGEVLGAVRLTFDAGAVRTHIESLWAVVAGVALISLAITALVSAAVVRWLSRPISDLAEAVNAFTLGDHEARADTTMGPPELRDLAERVNRMAARLTTLLQSQDQFIADASHQLRSPLHAIRLELEEGLPDEGVDAAGARRAADEVIRLGQAVDALLALARADSADEDVEPIDVATVVEERVRFWEALAAEQDVALSAVGPTPCMAAAVPGHLQQVLDNLIDNALAAAPSGSVVEIAWEQAAYGGTRIRVVDAGPGLHPEQRAHVFERFRSSRRGSGGSGLGLPIARQLARAGGGDVHLEEADTGGVMAVITLVAANRPAAVDQR